MQRAPAFVVPEHCTLVLELLLLVVVRGFEVSVGDVEGVVLVAPVPIAGLQTLQAVKPSACASATVVWKELLKYRHVSV